MTLVFVGRAEWRARAWQNRRPIPEPSARCRGWAFHFNGPPLNADGGQSEEMRKLRAIQNYHMDTKGWSDIAYSFAIGQSGLIYEGRGWDWDQFANGDDEVYPFNEGGNKRWRSICWLGGLGEEPTSEVIRNLTELVAYSRRIKNMGLEVKPHLDWQDKPCPGPRLTGLARTLDNWTIPIDIGDVIEPPDPLPEPEPELPPPPPSTELDMLTSIRAVGDGAIYLTDGRRKWWVDNGDHFDRSCFIGAVRYNGKDASGFYVPYEVSPEYVNWLWLEGPGPT